MGRVLQILVSARTYDEDEVAAAWPRLTELVWNELDGRGPAGMGRGVIELAENLSDVLKYSGRAGEGWRKLLPQAGQALRILDQMRAALAGWNPREAHRLSFELEDLLDEMERLAPPVRGSVLRGGRD